MALTHSQTHKCQFEAVAKSNIAWENRFGTLALNTRCDRFHSGPMKWCAHCDSLRMLVYLYSNAPAMLALANNRINPLLRGHISHLLSCYLCRRDMLPFSHQNTQINIALVSDKTALTLLGRSPLSPSAISSFSTTSVMMHASEKGGNVRHRNSQNRFAHPSIFFCWNGYLERFRLYRARMDATIHRQQSDSRSPVYQQTHPLSNIALLSLCSGHITEHIRAEIGWAWHSGQHQL